MLCHLYVVQQIIIALKVILLQLRLAAGLCPALQLTLQGFCCTLLAVSQADPIAVFQGSHWHSSLQDPQLHPHISRKKP